MTETKDTLALRRLRIITDGIDSTEIAREEGWWATDKGAEFGRQKLAELENMVMCLEAERDAAQEVAAMNARSGASWAARVQELEAQLDSIGAGAGSGPMMARAADHFPGVTKMTARWYMVDKDGMATLCTDREDAEQEAKDANMALPHTAPHRAVQLVEVGTSARKYEGQARDSYTAAEMAPAALRLAEELEHDPGINRPSVVAELRRLHAENTTLQQGYDAARLEIEGLRDRVQELGAMLRENCNRRIVELEAQLESIGAGGVEPLRRRECLHQIAEPAAQPAAGWWRQRADEIELEVAQGKSSAMRCYTDMRALLQASAGPEEEPAPAGEYPALPLAITSAPERIWLDLGFNPWEEDAHFSNLHRPTWSADNATGDGIEYVRADRAMRATLKQVGWFHTRQTYPKGELVSLRESLAPADIRDGWQQEPVFLVDHAMQTQAAPACQHRIADARNPVVKSGYICVDCGALFSAADHKEAAPAAVAGPSRINLRELGTELRKVLYCLGGPEIWALYRDDTQVRYLDKFENDFVDSALAAAPTTQVAPAAQGDALESEYQRGYRQGYEQRDAEVRGALA